MNDELRKAVKQFLLAHDTYGANNAIKNLRIEDLRAALAKNANAAPQDDPKSVDCERCGLTPELHTPTHWCDNQSFQVAAPEPQPQRKEYMVRDLTGAEIYKLWREHQTSSISTFVRR